MAPYSYATRPRKAAHEYRKLGAVTFLAMQAVGRTGKVDISGCRIIDGITVQHVAVGRIRSTPTIVSQALNAVVVYLPALLRLAIQIIRTPAGVVQVTGAPLIPLAWLHHRRHRSKIVLDINERPASSSARGSLFSSFRRIEPMLLRLGAQIATLTTAVTPGHARILESEYDYSGVLTVKNAPLMSWRARYVDPPPRRPGAPLHLVTVGTLFERRGYEALIEAAKLAQQNGTPVIIDVHGGGRDDYVRRLEALARTLGVSDVVRLQGHCPTERVSESYLRGHVGLALYEVQDPSNDSLSNKLLECVSSGRPVLAGDMVENRRFVQDNGVGWLSGVSPRALARAFAEIAEHDDLATLSRRCRKLGDAQLTWEQQFSPVLSRIRSSTPKAGNRV